MVSADAGLQGGARLFVDLERDAEGLGHAFGRNVVVGGPDTAGGQNVVEFLPDLIDRGNDGVLVIGNDPGLAQPDAKIIQPPSNIGEVYVLHAAR